MGRIIIYFTIILFLALMADRLPWLNFKTAIQNKLPSNLSFTPLEKVHSLTGFSDNLELQQLSATSTPTVLTPKRPESNKTLPQSDNKQQSATQPYFDQIQNQINQATQSLNNLLKNQAPTPPPPAPTRLSQQELYNKALERVVNFFCQQGNQVRVASGILISPKGHILTNAHVTQDFDNNFECLIRQGSPARNLGYAKIVFYPQAFEKATSKTQEAENDAAIWLLTRPPGENPLPQTFPFYDIDTNYLPALNQPLVTFSYAAELLGYETVLKSLNLLFAETIVTEFDKDIIISATGLSSQVGSSGGALVDVYANKFAGLIFAVSKEEQINQRKLLSLTPASIERIFQTETGQSLQDFLK